MAILIVILGVLSALRTPVDIFPEIRVPVIAVAWTYSGLSPDDMAGRMITPYERALTTTVNDIDHIESDPALHPAAAPAGHRGRAASRRGGQCPDRGGARGLLPRHTLGATGGYQTAHGDLLASPNRYWALGPLSLGLPIFDGGARKAGLRLAGAEHEEASAAYRQTALAAFQEVEDDGHQPPAGLADWQPLARRPGRGQGARPGARAVSRRRGRISESGHGPDRRARRPARSWPCKARRCA